MWVGRIAVAVAATALIAWPAGAADVQIKAKDNYFTPSSRIITVGDTVTWVNAGDLSHTVSSFPSAATEFDSSPDDDTCDDGNPLTEENCLDPGDQFEATFTAPGIYDYRCKIHGTTASKPTSAGDQSETCGMCGRIDVRAASSRAPEPTETPTLDRPNPSSPTPSVSPSASPSASGEPSDDPSPDPTTSGLAAGGDGGGGSGGRALVAVLAIGALSGAGFFTWRRFLSTR